MREVILLCRPHVAGSRLGLLVCLLAASCAPARGTATGGTGGAGARDASATGGASAATGGRDGSVDSSSALWPCAPPADPTQPHSALAATGCMDAVAITHFTSTAHG